MVPPARMANVQYLRGQSIITRTLTGNRGSVNAIQAEEHGDYICGAGSVYLVPQFLQLPLGKPPVGRLETALDLPSVSFENPAIDIRDSRPVEAIANVNQVLNLRTCGCGFHGAHSLKVAKKDCIDKMTETETRNQSLIYNHLPA